MIFSEDIDSKDLSTIVVGKYKYIVDFNQDSSEADIIELRKALDYNLGFKDIIKKKLSNSRFIENAPDNVIQGERNKLRCFEKLKLLNKQFLKIKLLLLFLLL